MIRTTSKRMTLVAGVLGVLAGGCKSGEEPGKTKAASAAKTRSDAKADEKTKGGGGSDEVADATPAEVVDDAAPADEDEAAELDPRVSQAARVAQDISDDPAKADDVLAAADLDREKLDALMYEIASDPDLTEQYRVARGL